MNRTHFRHIVIVLFFFSLSAYSQGKIGLYAGSDTTYYPDLASALKEANKQSGSVMQLLDDVGMSGLAVSQTIKSSMTIDLNGFCLGDTLSGSTLLSVKADSVVLTVTSSREGGRIHVTGEYNGKISAIYVSGGSLELSHVTIEAENTAPYDTLLFPNTSAGCIAGLNDSRIEIEDCRLSCRSNKAATAVSGTRKEGLFTSIHVKDSEIEANGRTTVYGINGYGTTFVADSRIAVYSSETSAYGVYINEPPDSIPFIPEQASVHNVRIIGSADERMSGIYSRAPLSLSRDSIHARVRTGQATGVNCVKQLQASECVIEVLSDSSTSFGFYLGERTDADIRSCPVSASGKLRVYGVYTRGTLQLRESPISVRADSSMSYCLYVYNDSLPCTVEGCVMVSHADIDYAYSIVSHKGSVNVNKCELYASAGNKYAYSFYPNTDTQYAELHDCYMRASAPESFSAVRKNTAVLGNVYLYGGYYSDKDNLSRYLPENYFVYRTMDHEDEYVQGFRYTVQPIAKPNAIVAVIYDHPEDPSPTNRFYQITKAFDYLNTHAEDSVTLVITGSCILPSGEYIIPEKATVVVAYQDDQTRAIGSKARREKQKLTRKEYARLCLSDSALLRVKGTLETSALQKTTGTNTGVVTGDYGLIVLSPESRIQLEDGAEMNVWGSVIGEGVVEALSGSSIRESLQIGDWKGAKIVFEMLQNTQHVFPISHYFYQNIEAPVIYHSGARAYGSCAVTITDAEILISYDSIQLIHNSNAMFVTDDHSDAVIRKRYNAPADRMEWTTTGNVTLSELGISFEAGNLPTFDMLSSDYQLPLCSNTTIQVESGQLSLEHDAVMLPGAELHIAPDASIRIPEGVSLYLYDDSLWGAFNNIRFPTVAWSPSWDVCPRDSLFRSARINISGEMDVQGALLATKDGAQVHGTDEAEGVVRIAQKGQTGVVYQLTGNQEAYFFTANAVGSAPLHNADGSLVQTGRKGEYKYIDGVWNAPEKNPDDPDEGTECVLAESLPRKILQGQELYILMPDGRKYGPNGGLRMEN